MIRLLRKPFGIHGKVHEITSSSAGWRYVGFSLWRLRVGETVSETTGDCEVILVMVEGKARLAGAGRNWGVLGERMNVFDKTPPHCLYLPSGAEWKAMPETDCVIAVCPRRGREGTKRAASSRRASRSPSAARAPTRSSTTSLWRTRTICDSP